MAVNFDKVKPKNPTQELILGLYHVMKGFEEKLETKDANVAVPVSVSPSTGHYTNMPNSSGVGQQTASYNHSMVVWPAPNQFTTHGKEAAKKAWVEYINAANQYQQEEGPERKLELAGRMNTDITSIIQGLQIGTEAAEEIQKRVRSGDQAAVLDKEIVKDILSKLLKILWVHNTAARSGKNAGMEFKPMDGQLTGRLNRAAQIACADDGMSLEAGEDPDAIFASEYNPMPSQEQQQQAQEQAAATAGAQTDATMPEMEGEQMESQQNPAEEQAPVEDVAEEEIPPEETPQAEEQTPQEELQQQAIEEEQPVEETMSPDEQQAQEQGTMENLVGEENIPEEEQSLEEEAAPMPEEEVAPEEEEDVEAQEEIDEAQESTAEADAERAEANEAQTEADEQEAEAQVAEDQAGEESEEAGEETGEALEGQEPPEETAEEEIEDEDDEEPLYCIECDREVDEEDIQNCENPNCPFRASAETSEATGEQPVVEEEKKHFVFLTRDDHSECRTANFTVKDYDGLKGQYCHDHECAVHYEFDQNIWTSEDAHKWVVKNIKTNELKKKTAEEIVYDHLPDIPGDIIKKWMLEERDRKSTPTEEIEKQIEEKSIEFDFDEGQIEDALSQAFSGYLSSLDERLKRHGV